MSSLIETAPDGTPEQILTHVTAGLAGILTIKRRDVAWKLASVRTAFDSQVAPLLADARLVPSQEGQEAHNSDVVVIAERIMSDVVVSPNGWVTPPGYAHLSLALIDAVYSIRSRYAAVKRVVEAYGRVSGTQCESVRARANPGFREHGLDSLLDQARTLHGAELADLLFAGSRSRTAGRLKADVCIEAAQRLHALSVTHVPELRERADDPAVRQAWTGVHGLGWITWQYFCALVGIDQLKPDVMLTRFVAQTLGRYVSPAETDALLSSACEQLRAQYPDLTKRTLDHTIWHFQRSWQQ
jgi:hypothetical protein